MEDLRKKIGERMRNARKSRGITQRQLHERTGLDQSFISRVERGSADGSAVQILKIADAIGVPIAELCEEPGKNAALRAELSDEAIEFARMWEGLPVEQKAAMKAAVRALAQQARVEVGE